MEQVTITRDVHDMTPSLVDRAGQTDQWMDRHWTLVLLHSPQNILYQGMKS